LRSYLIELNIYESIFSNTLHGDILLSDSRNLIKEFDIIGEESLIVKVVTPGLSNKIHRTFRIVAVEDRSIIRDQNTQIYKLVFVSYEALIDSLSPLYSAFKGSIHDIVSKIYLDNLNFERNLIYNGDKIKKSNNTTELLVFSESSNIAKFVSPGWTPFQCINWIAKKAIPKFGKACTFLFWETNRRFYFGSIEDIFNSASTIGSYNYAAVSVSIGTDDIEEKMKLIQKLVIKKGLNNLTNADNGYYGSKVLSVDLFKKKTTTSDYDHVRSFNTYKHLTKNNPLPLYTPGINIRNFNSHIKVYPNHTGMHTQVTNNYNERIGEIYGNRLSNMLELNALVLEIIIYGRTDVEAGRLINIKFPDISPVDETDITSENLDSRYTGKYLITSIHHKINFLNHSMAMEVVKDSFSSDPINAG
jgi:hypothetical protein